MNTYPGPVNTSCGEKVNTYPGPVNTYYGKTFFKMKAGWLSSPKIPWNPTLLSQLLVRRGGSEAGRGQTIFQKFDVQAAHWQDCCASFRGRHANMCFSGRFRFSSKVKRNRDVEAAPKQVWTSKGPRCISYLNRWKEFLKS